MNIALTINYLQSSRPRETKRSRRLNKKLALNEFRIETLKICFSHGYPQTKDDDILEQLVVIAIDLGLVLGFASDREGNACAIFEINSDAIPAKIQLDVCNRLVDVTSIEVSKCEVDDANWPTHQRSITSK